MHANTIRPAALLRFRKDQLHRVTARLAYQRALRRFHDLVGFDRFLSDMEGLGLHKGLHQSPGAYEVIENANRLLAAALEDCTDELARLSEELG